MTADVYAGDDDLRAGRRAASPTTRFRYRIEADAEPDVLGRIGNQLNFASAAPWSLTLARTDDGYVVVDVELRGLSDAMAELIRRKLLQQTCVVAVGLYVPA